MTRRTLVYVIGMPGAGKTTAMKGAIERLGGNGLVEYTAPFAHRVFLYDGEPVAVWGAERGVFSGTDALSMNVQPVAVRWVCTGGTLTYDRVLVEGDRLANNAFFSAVEQSDLALSVVLINVGPGTAAERREARGVGRQDATWVKGRETKVQRLTDRWVRPSNVIDGEQGPDAVAEALAERIKALWA